MIVDGSTDGKASKTKASKKLFRKSSKAVKAKAFKTNAVKSLQTKPSINGTNNTSCIGATSNSTDDQAQKKKKTGG